MMSLRVPYLECLNTDWFDLLTEDAFSHQHTVSISGGTETVRYYSSVGYAKDNDVIKGNNNEEILVHIGIDTVKLEGKYFTPNVKTNDIVMPGDLLATIELDKIIEAGYDPTVMVIDTADSSKRNVTLLAKNTVHAKDDLVLIESI